MTILRVLSIAVTLSACGARLQENHTGGKTSWLQSCNRDGDCNALQDAICVQRLCTTACDDGCPISGTQCSSLTVNGGAREEVTKACLPTCQDPEDCSGFGSVYTCESNACVLATGSEHPRDVVPSSPVHDIAGVVLLDTGDDGDNTPLEDAKAPAGFSSYGFWYTYDDFETCKGDQDPNAATPVNRRLTP